MLLKLITLTMLASAIPNGEAGRQSLTRAMLGLDASSENEFKVNLPK